MGILKSHSDLRALKEAGRITQAVLNALGNACVPGASTMELEVLANRLLAQSRSTAPFKLFDGFNHAICISFNEEIVNGPPSRLRVIQTGDVISIATAAEYRGIHAKAARTFFIGTDPSADINRLLIGTAEVIQRAITVSQQVKTLNELLAVGPQTAEEYNLALIPNLGGAGIGKKLHDTLSIPNDPAELSELIPLQPGLCFTLMPMFSLGKTLPFETHQDGWTLVTSDRSLSAHFADTLLMTETGLELITA